MKELSLRELIDTGMQSHPEVIEKLVKVVQLDNRLTWKPGSPSDPVAANCVAERIIQLGNHPWAIFRDDYAAIVVKVGKRLGAKVSSENDIESNELRIVERIFAQVWDRLSPQERAAILVGMNLPTEQISAVTMLSSSILASQVVLWLGRESVLALADLVFAAAIRFIFREAVVITAETAASTAIGVLIGPVGWAITGFWLAYDLQGPSWKTTTEAVILLAAMRRSMVSDPMRRRRRQ